MRLAYGGAATTNTKEVEPRPRQRRGSHLLRALVRNGVEFVIVGGVAAQLRGWAGATADLDIAVASEESNAERMNRALAEVGLMKTDMGGLGTSFETRYGRLEIVRRADGIGMYDD